MHKSIPILILAALCVSASAFAAAPCDRSLNRNSMTEKESAEVAKSGIVRRDVARGDYYVSYLFAEARFDVELAMGVYISCGEHAGKNGLGDFIKQSVMKSEPKANPFRVFYEQAGSMGFSGGEYTVVNSVTADNGSYIMNTSLASSSDAHFSPRAMDGYVRMFSNDRGGVFVIACNFMEPRDPPFPAAISRGKYNKMAKERLSQTGKNLMTWVDRVSQNSTRADGYREHLKTVLGNRR